MAEINAAWDVLRSPASRAAYDDALAGRAVVASPGSPSGAPAPGSAPRPAARRGSAPPPSFADQLVDPTRVDPVPRRSGWRWAPAVVLVVLVVGLGAWALAASHEPSTPPAPGVELQTGSFQVGSCVAVTPGPEAVTVPCSAPNSGRVAATTDYPRPCPPDTDTVSLPSRQVSLCLVPT